MWFVLVRRGYTYQLYLVLSARELEEYLGRFVKTLRNGHTLLATDNEVKFTAPDGRTQAVTRPPFGRMRDMYIACIIIVMFGVFHPTLWLCIRYL